MKNTFLTAIVVCTIAVGSVFTSCSKNDINQAGNKALLTAGKWQLLSATSTINGGAGVTIPNAPQTISFTSNNRYRIYDDQGGVIHDVPYTFDDKNTISFDGDTYDMTTINQSNLTLATYSTDSTVVDTYIYNRQL